jgi:hypothetical protein
MLGVDERCDADDDWQAQFSSGPLLLQENLQQQITGALGQLSRASQLLTSHPELAGTAQLDEMIEEVIRQQNEIADKHDAWADATGGDASRTMHLGIEQGMTKQVTQRCTSAVVLADTTHLRALLAGRHAVAVRIMVRRSQREHCRYAVDGRDKDHNKEIYYERTIQTLEQQLLAFQQGLNCTPPEYDDDLNSVSEASNSGMDDNNGELAVAEYMRKCR